MLLRAGQRLAAHQPRQRLANGQDFDPDYSIRNLQQHMLITAGQQALTNARHTITHLLQRT